ncbi:hypothetical protein ACG7TL_006263 [Trametes sanguinea]
MVAKSESSATASWLEAGLSEEQIHAARTCATVCQFAFSLLAIILGSPPLYGLFPGRVLQHLLKDVLKVVQAPELPALDDVKIRALAAHALATLCLPAEIVQANRSAIVDCLRDSALTMSPQLRACEVIHNMLSTYPHIFLRESAELLPDVLSKLTSTTASGRMDAAVALAGFASGLLSISCKTMDNEPTAVHTTVHKYIRSQMPNSRRGRHQPAPTLLPDCIAHAAKGSPTDSNGNSPRWAISVICCLIILSGQGIFTGQRAFRLVLDTVEQVARSKNAVGMDLVACVWKCLVWAFFQLPRADTSGVGVVEPGPDNQREVLFNLVRQELRGGTGAYLVAGLLYKDDRQGSDTGTTHRGSNLDWVITVLQDMVNHSSSSVFKDSVVLLERLLSAIGSSSDDISNLEPNHWNPNDVAVKVLFSRHILKADHQTFSTALHAANKFHAACVRPLGEAEILLKWDDIVDIWELSVRRQLRVAGSIFSISVRALDWLSPFVQLMLGGEKDALVHAWQALLLVQTQLTQEKGHLTTTSNLRNRTLSIISDFLAWSPGPDDENPVPLDEAQYRVLMLCHQLWAVMRHVFADSWLSTTAESILASVLRRTFDLSNERIRDTWSQFCSALVSVSAPKLLMTLVVEEEDRRVVDVKRELWRMTADQWSLRTPTPTWEDTVEFLAIPLRNWKLEENEISAWCAVFDNTLTQTTSFIAHHGLILDALVESLPDDAAPKKMLDNSTIALHMLHRLRISEDTELPLKFLECLDALLRLLYSDLPEHVTLALQILAHVRRVLNECPSSALVSMLVTLSTGLVVWVGDECELLLNSEYNDVVIPIYCDALHSLRAVTMTPGMLESLAPLLYAAFVRMPDPGHGPVAFYEFWLHIQPHLQGMRGAYPEQIKIALRACNDVFGGISSQDLSMDTDSHSDSQHTPRAQITPIKSESMTPRSTASIRDRLYELQRSPLAAPPFRQNLSPTVNPEIPFHVPMSPAIDETLRRKRARGPDSPPSRATSSHRASSDYMPSSPTDALRARRFAAGPTSRVAHERAAKPTDRPSKRRKVEGSVSTATSRALESPARSSRPPPRVDTEQKAGRRSSRTPPATKSKGKEVLRPSSSAATPASDDYDAWEAPILEDEDEDERVLGDRDEVVPSSQPSDEHGSDDDSFLPSFMKTAGRAADGQNPRSDDTMILDHLDEDNALDLPFTLTVPAHPHPHGRPRSSSAHRTHTAPATLERSSPPHAPRSPSPSPSRRARTASAQLEELRNVYDALREEGSQLPVGAIAAASELTNRLGAMLSEKLSRRLRESEVGRDSSARKRGKGKERER